MKRALLLACLGLLSFGHADFVGAQEIHQDGRIRTAKADNKASGEILVRFKPGIPEAVIEKLNRRHGTSILSVNKTAQFSRLKIPKNKTVDEMVAIYSRNPHVDYAEPNFIATAHFVPNDTYYGLQWHLDNDDYGGIQMESAWDIQTGDPSVIVAVIDTGVAYEDYGIYKQAPDLANTVFVPGYDYVNSDTHPNDDDNHGTHVTGTIAQSTHNNLGMAGVAFGTAIMPIKVLNQNGSGSYFNIAQGIYFAANNGADAINMSLGGTSPSLTLRNALIYAHNQGVTIACSAGNSFQSGNAANYPGSYPECIAVAATGYDGNRSYYSTTGSYVDIAAPGGDLSADLNNDGYGDGVLQQTFSGSPSNFGYWFFHGTSMASPHVAGVAALLIASGVSDPDDVREAMEQTAIDVGAPGRDNEYGWGLLDAYAALNYFGAPPPPPPPPVLEHDVAVTDLSAPGEATEGDLVPVDVTVENPGDYDEAITVALTDTTDNVIIGQDIINLLAGASTDLNYDWDTSGASLGDHDLVADVSIADSDVNPANDSLGTTTTVNEDVPPVESAVHVSDISMQLKKKGRGYSAKASVKVVDENGTAVSNATVRGDWYFKGLYLNSASASVRKGGVAKLNSNRINASSGDTFLFVVINILKSGYSYDDSSNVETSDSITVP